MSIEFEVCKDKGYYISKLVGPITDVELIDTYRTFLGSTDWSVDLNELADLSKADFSAVTTGGLHALASLIKRVATKYNWKPRVAVYAPNDLPFGMARMYSIKAKEFEAFDVFRDLDKAINWLINDNSE